jgi:hypothetical protein
MRQWELFGITDSQPAWTPPKKAAESDTIRLITPEPDEGEQEQLGAARPLAVRYHVPGEPTVSGDVVRPDPVDARGFVPQPLNGAAAWSTAAISSGPCVVDSAHSSKPEGGR